MMPGSCNAPLYALSILDPSLVYASLSEGLPVTDKSVTQMVSRIAEKAGCSIASSLHASVPFFYMEMKRLLEYLSSVGVYTIDMKLAYILRILDALKKKFVGLVFVEDSPLHGIEYMSEKYENVRESIYRAKKEVIPRIVLEFLRSK